MYILGISCYYHDSSASIIKDGVVLAAADEERFSRTKHDFSFPINAINFCLNSQGISTDQIEYIAFYEKPLLKIERILYQVIDFFPRSFFIFLSSMPLFFTKKLRIIKTIKKKLGYKKDVIFVRHHCAHAASAFFCSPFNDAAIVTIDGVGEWSTVTIGQGNDNKIKLLKEIIFPHSLGLLYSAITAYLGFSVNNSEYKVMGLAAYGVWEKEKNQFYNKLTKTIDIKDDGSFCLDMKYFSYCYQEKMYSNNLQVLLGLEPRKKNDEINQDHKNVAAALQMIAEEAVLKILNHAKNITGLDKLVISGGVALNSAINGKILEKTNFNDLWIQPAAGDGGTSLGAAMYVYNQILDKERVCGFSDCYLGPNYSDSYIEKTLSDNNLNFYKFKDNDELIDKTAELISNNNVIAWFQGRMEWGPRALGDRSILANPLNPNMRDVLNIKVKHREVFRPFAPAICCDDVEKFFYCKQNQTINEFMLQVVKIKEEYIDKVPSVVHVDGTSRIQSVVREKNKLFYDLIKKFGKISGIPMLINTSFNVRGEPIVCTPEDAIKCFNGTGIDYLVIESFLVKKADYNFNKIIKNYGK